MSLPQIVLFRRDLRLADQPALCAAARAGPVVPVYVLDDDAAGEFALGGASRWWLHHSLTSLARDLEALGSRLVLRRGNAAEQIARLAEETGAVQVHAVRHYEPWWQQTEAELGEGLDLTLYDGNYLLPPGAVRTGSGEPYKIYTPFAKAVLAQMPPHDPLPTPERLAAPAQWPAGDELRSWDLLPSAPDWSGGLGEFWQVGEAAAHDRLAEWADSVADYTDARNLPSTDGSSRLSPHLHWGEISPAQVWHMLSGRTSDGWSTFAKELVWRDYAQNVIDQFPDYGTRSYRNGYDGLWRTGAEARRDLTAWQRGRTGYPIVDAGMRQLWQTGWMHNRVRMITASFLVKHLLIDWRAGERWFWDTLVDADYGNNAVNWQWVAGTGVDSNMFVRIMAPLTQSEKFAAADYIRAYVPELAHLDDAQIHDPPDRLRGDYPAKLIGHREARERALAAYRTSRS
ncbi:deoxyribodipyrimidine photo-lyase [Parafrankia sp. BMG5.11]|uniref:cryptochrome/photolyase family protein n=1 Tax=Parafrankia sp. BMG5.11 TaxID=222540 RepID=UPI00103F2A95|nr:deoxyribodipyrimidine photo-lyase [Parafrankia sp. BMG5.11]TCJ37301.1 deoxyribodipyrimidine photo-lyase [Parafrankia sp. BMG5.11]